MNVAQFRLHAEIEEAHWWFVARRRIMRRVLREALPPGPDRLVVDVEHDLGTGAVPVRIVMLVVAIVGKFAGAMVIREPAERRVLVGMGMVPRGEVGLVFTELGRDSGLLDGGIYDVLILVIAYTTLVAPFWIKWYYRHHAAHLEPSVPEEDMGYPMLPDAGATGPPGLAGGHLPAAHHEPVATPKETL